MKICILGIGGVGGYVGGCLAQNAVHENNQVCFFARGPHLQAIKTNGLKVKTDKEEFIAVPQLATDNPLDIGEVDVLIAAVKTYDLFEATEVMTKLVNGNTIILPLMNGVNQVKELEKIFPVNLIADACIYIASSIDSPGIISTKNMQCKIIMGKDQGSITRLQPIQHTLINSGIDVELLQEPYKEIWTKYIFISALACTTSLYGEETGRIMEDNTKKGLFMGLTKEAEAVARKAGIDLPSDIVEQIMARARQAGYNTKTSMLRDFEQGKKTELNSLCGEIVRQGEKLGVNTPLYKKVYAILQRW